MENASKRKSKALSVVLVGVVVIAVILGVVAYRSGASKESTDDAQIETDMSPIAPKVSGFVTEINVEDNQHVKQGDVLVRLDARDFSIKLEQAEAALENAQANLNAIRSSAKSVKTNISTVDANIEAAKSRLWQAEQEYTRYSNLFKEGSATKQQYDMAKANKETLEAQYQAVLRQRTSASASYDASDSQVAVAASLVKQRLAEVDFAKLQLSYTELRAPFDAIVARKNIQQGQLVQVGQALFSLVKSGEVWVVANFKETQLEKMKIGQKAEIEVDAFPDRVIEGEIMSFSPATGAKFSLLPPDNSSGNFVKVVQRIPVKIKLQSKDQSILKAGMNVKASILLN